MAFNIVAGVNNAVYGSVSGSGSYEEGVEVTLEVTANDGYRFVEWSDGNTDNPRTFNATEDVTLTATLEAIPEYAVTLNTNNSNLGTTSGSGNYREGSTATISATPSLHCRFVKWDDDNTDNPRSITVNSAVTLEAIFETVNWYSITTSVNDATMGSVTGAGDYDEGETITLTASPNTDYKFVAWNDGNTDNPRTFTAATSSNYEATFAEIVYANVTIESNDNELGSVSGATSGNIEVGTEITLTATPETDCRFVGWEIDGVAYSYNDTLIYDITDDVTITAVFEAITFYQVNLITSDSEYGSINVVSASETARGENNNIYPEYTTLSLSAIPTASGKFLNWGDGDINTGKTIVVDNNMTIRANFYPATGLLLVAAHKIQKIWTSIKSFFSASTGASKIGVPVNNALGATTVADVVNSVGQANGLAQLNANGKINGTDIEGSLAIDISGNAATATTASKVGIATVGSSSQPIYLNAGTPALCNEFATLYDNPGNSVEAQVGYLTVNVSSGQSASYYYDSDSASIYSQPIAIDTTKADLYVTVSKSGNYLSFTHTFENVDDQHAYNIDSVFNMPYLTAAPSYNSTGSSSSEVRSGTYGVDEIVIRCSSSFGEGEPWNLVRYGNSASFFNTSRGDSGYPKWFEIYTSTPILVKEFKLLPRQDSTYGPDEYPKEFKLQGSSNGTDYTDIASYTQTDTVSASGVYYTYSCPNNTGLYNYHRLLISSRMAGTDNVVSLSKFLITEAYTSNITLTSSTDIASSPVSFSSSSNIAAGIAEVPIGSASIPVYVNSNGRVVTCGNSLNVNITGNAATATDLNKEAIDYPKGEILSLSAKGLTTAEIALANGVIDSSGKGNHGQAYGGVSVVTDSEMGDCFSFDGTDDYIKSDNAALMTAMNSCKGYTISVECKFEYALTQERIGGMTDTLNGNCGGFTRNDSGVLTFFDRSKSSDEIKSITYELGNEALNIHTFTATVDYTNGTAKLFVDGALAVEDDEWFVAESKQDTTHLWIGTINNQAYFNGLISDIRIYPRAFSAKEIKSLYMLGSIDTSFAGKSDSAIRDASGNVITSTYATIAKTYDDTTNTSYRGMLGLDGSTSGWVRTTTNGIIPVQAGAAGSGHSSLGTSSWRFAAAYIDSIYGELHSANDSSITNLANVSARTQCVSFYNTIKTGITGLFATTNYANGIISIDRHNTDGGKYNSQVGFSSNGNIYYRSFDNAVPDTSTTWKQIAFTDSNITGNAASATYATNIRVTNTKNNNYYYAVGTSGNTASTNYAPAVFPNIVIRDDTDSTSEAFSRLSLGNSTAKGTSGGKTGCLTLYGNNTKLCNLLGPEGASANFNVRLPASGGTLALTSSNITGNAATATTAAACSGNAATATTATNANNAKLTHTVGNSEYPLIFGSSFVITDAQQALRIGTPSATAANCPLRVKAYCAAANTQGEAYLVLGNNLATASANNSRGGLAIYGVGTAYNFIKMNTVNTNGKTIFLNTANSADITLTLPSSTGTLALTSQIPATSWCTTKATTTNNASSSKPCVVVEQKYNSSTGFWYRKWSDGWIENGGLITCSGGNISEYTFYQAFSSTNYSIIGGQEIIDASTGTADNGNPTTFYRYSTSKFKIAVYAYGKRCFFYACGY